MMTTRINVFNKNFFDNEASKLYRAKKQNNVGYELAKQTFTFIYKYLLTNDNFKRDCMDEVNGTYAITLHNTCCDFKRELLAIFNMFDNVEIDNDNTYANATHAPYIQIKVEFIPNYPQEYIKINTEYLKELI